ncbi:MAG: DUF177 domain-containing protein [Nitrospirae bacterium]|nr:DUF177 domain-containing protein [Nitrospirota bacterium]
MKIIVSEIPDEGIYINIAETIHPESVKLLSPIKGFVKITKIESEVFVNGEANNVVEQQCSRCLKDFPLPIELQINAVYHPAEVSKKGELHRLKSDELDTGFYENDEIDINSMLEEQLLLGIPMKPLCSADCKGLCPQCGADLNERRCNCDKEELDARFAVLKKLLKGKE